LAVSAGFSTARQSGFFAQSDAQAYPRHCERSDLSAEALAKAEAIQTISAGRTQYCVVPLATTNKKIKGEDSNDV
jgi:hypothetical protein